MNFFVRAIAINPITKQEYNPCGSEYGSFIHDLKTIQGVYNRVKSGKWNQSVLRVEICMYGRIFDESSYRVVKSFIP